MIFLGYIDPGSGFTIAGFGAFLWAALAATVGFVGMRWRKFLRPGLLVMLALVGAASAWYFLNADKRSALDGKRIILLGFDGLSPVITESMMAEGQLPNFSHLKQAGSYAPLATTNPPQSPVAWSAFSTGKNPGKNGIHDFIVRDKDYKLDLSMANARGGRARRVVQAPYFWETASGRGVRSVILGCPVTFPPGRFKGRLLSGMGVPDVLGTEGTFSFYTSEKGAPSAVEGGQVFRVDRTDSMSLELNGPKVAGFGAARNVKVPFLAEREGGGVRLTVQGKSTLLEPGQWSPWQEVSFRIGLLRKMKGIFRFYLVETSPEFKLYASPVNFDPREPYLPVSYPAGYSRELAEKLGLFHTAGMPLETWSLNEKRLDEKAFLEQAERVSEERRRLLHHELDRLRDGMLFCYFGDTDIIQHVFWRYTDPDHPSYPAEAPEEYRQMIRSWYRRADAILGEVMQKTRPDDLLLVFSDHGFDTFERAVHLNSRLRDSGYLVPDGSGTVGELLQGVDWDHTRAYAIGYGGIYLNRAGRESRGIVAPGPQAERLKEEIAERLKQWTDPKDGRPIVHEVYRGEDIFRGPYADRMPDLYVGFNKGYQASWQTALGAAPAGQIEDNLKKWSGTHLFDPVFVPGVLFSSRRLGKSDPSLYDLAPTLLKECGFSEKELEGLGLDGRPLF